MSSTPSEGPAAAAPPHARATDQAASDPAALLQRQRAAECALADALAQFQAEVSSATEMSLPAVVEAARGAFRLGFAYTSCRGLDDDGQPLLEVTVMHRGGDQLSGQVRLQNGDPEQEFNAAARLLAQLLGIPVLSAAPQAQPCKAEQVMPVAEVASGPATEGAGPPSPSATAALAPTATPPAAASQPAPADPIGPGSPDAPGTEESLRPLEEAEREVLLEMIRSLRPVEARRQFQIAFRHHFNVPKQARSIAGFITQQRHKDFIDRFERELADLPPAAAEASS